MPTSTLPSGSVRTHSWLFVYRSSAGMSLISFSVSKFDQTLAVAHERRLDDAGGEALAADVDFDLPCRGSRQAREADRALEGRRERAAGHLTRAGAARVHGLVRAQHAAVFEQQADQLAGRARCPLGDQCFLADEIAVAVEHDG